MTLPARVLEHCRARLEIPAGARLAVAVSGGLDSVVLLEVLLRIRAALKVELVVATLDHGLRGVDSAADAAFVRRLACDHGLPCYTMRLQGVEGRGLEDGARRERHAFLRGVPADLVALGHNRDDQAETVLLRILRSADPHGLRGMLPDDGLLVRPLLDEPRAALLAWAQEQGLTWRDDASNQDLGLERNRLRHEVMPLLETVHGGAGRRLAELAHLLAEDRDRAPPGVEAAVRRSWLSAHLVHECTTRTARTQLIRTFAAGVTRRHDALGAAGAARALELLERERGGAWVPLAGNGRLAVVAQGLCCLPPPPEPLTLHLPGVRHWGVHDLEVSRSDGARTPFTLRAPLPGERHRGQPLREWLRHRGVPAALRPYHPVFCWEGQPFWIPPGPPDEPPTHWGLAMHLTASIAIREQAGRGWSAEL